MASPFPGMDPYLESSTIWADFHQEFASALRRVLRPLLPRRYFVKLGHRSVIDRGSSEELGVVIPDAAVVRHESSAPAEAGPAPEAGRIAAPIEVELELALPGKQFFLEVVEVEGDRLVTAIELLSPANKRAGSRDRLRYLGKRDRYLAGEVHFVEVDLLRGGERWRAGREPPSDYRVLLHRADRRLHAEVWPIGLRDPLPTIPIPLLNGDPEIPLPLAEAFRVAYVGAAYEVYLRYDPAELPPPMLSGADLAWVKERVRAAGRPS
ncbi:MAG: DUF4058 family protein [Planctomycetes bacterium]|nr:DUF4058 family protein [Planctomycetota bacterium]